MHSNVSMNEPKDFKLFSTTKANALFLFQTQPLRAALKG